jgi:hypothetical protein
MIQLFQINVPEEVQEQLFNHYGNPEVIALYWNRYTAFILLFLLKPIVIYAIDLFYAVMAIRCILRRYKLLQEQQNRTEQNRTEQNSRKNKVWAIHTIIIVVMSAVVFLIFSQQSIAQFNIILLLLIIVMNNIIDIHLVYYLLSGNYQLYMLPSESFAGNRSGNTPTSITVRRFEHYMSDNKQRYMDNQSRISDIYNDFNITAEEFTEFIQAHYHQMPGIWLRRWRRIQESEQLTDRDRPTNHKK